MVATSEAAGRGKGKGKGGDAKKLSEEVSNVARKLGLGGAGGEDGFEFDDFAPKKQAQAKKQAAADSGAPASKRGPGEARKQERTAAAPQRGRNGPPAAKPHGRGPAGKREDGKAPAEAGKPPKRRWNEGAGPRPTGGPLLGSDEPSHWLSAVEALPPLPEGGGQPPTQDQVDAARTRGDALLESEAASFDSAVHRRNPRDARWLATARKSGTSADKLAAAALVIQESPVANLRSLDMLIGWVARSKGGRSAATQAIATLTELLVDHLLPDRHLRFLDQQPLGALEKLPRRDADRWLLYMTFEESLKRRVALLVESLEKATVDGIDYVKEKAIKGVYELLANKPEQEVKLLAVLVNKLGDPARKVASKASYMLSCLVTEHPSMKLVVVRECERFVLRPGLPDRARYYAVIFLSQIVLSHREADGGGPQLARKLVEVYFSLFALLVEGRIGRGRTQQDAREAKAQAAGGGAKLRKAQAAVREGAKQSAAEIDARILSAILTGLNRAFPYVAAEEVEPILEEYSGAIYKMAHARSFNVGVQALTLLFQAMSSRTAVSDRFYRALYAALLHPGFASSSKLPLCLSLLFKALKADVSVPRTAAFVKRMLQVAAANGPGLACGTLMMFSELCKARPALWNLITQPGEEGADGDLERFRDEDDSDDPASNGAARREAPRATAELWPRPGTYDMRKRDPLHACADRTCMWELSALAGHAHPSVAAMARALLSGTNVVYQGDPLRDFSLSAFLDKMIAKKPKAKAGGSKAALPFRSTDASASLATVAHASFAALAESQVDAADVALHRYLNTPSVRAKREAREKARRERKKAEAGAGSDSEEEDAFLDRAERAEVRGVGEEDGASDGEGGYDYADLANAMSDDEDSDHGSSADGEDDGSDSSEGEWETGAEGAAALEEEGSDGDESLPGGGDSDESLPEPVSSGSEGEGDGDDEAARMSRVLRSHRSRKRKGDVSTELADADDDLMALIERNMQAVDAAAEEGAGAEEGPGGGRREGGGRKRRKKGGRR
ncbi:unnamed protein product [Pedinophyceae sp. YPF-701]|nr:unnamed protein product [Pedinophyceae sp. YPF-701]